MKRLRIALILGVLLILAYWAIPNDHATMRLRVIVTAEVDGEKVEGASVMELTYTRISQSLMGMGGRTTLKAEALVLDLKNRGTVFMLPCKVNVDGTLSEVYEHYVMGSFGVEEPVGGMTDQGLAKLRKAKGRVPFRYYDTYWKRSNPPRFVAFKNEADPRSIYRVDENRLDLAFGPGVRLLGIELEPTDAPLSHVLAKRLPWLDQGNNINWERPRPGGGIPQREMPIGFVIVREKFYDNGSW
jgi:hypothetical protein